MLSVFVEHFLQIRLAASAARADAGKSGVEEFSE
jgi:hypothetical protein